MTEFFKHGRMTLSLSGLRSVYEVEKNPCGGAPRSNKGVVAYEDGTVIETTLEFARALVAQITTNSSEPKQ